MVEVVGSIETALRIEAVHTSTIVEVFTVDQITTLMDTATDAVIMGTLAQVSLTTTTEALEVSLAVAEVLLPWEQVQDFWEVPWQV